VEKNLVALKALSDKLTETESMLSAFFNMREELFTVAELSGYFVRVNSRWEMELGWTPEEMCSQPYVNFIHPDDVQKTHEAEVMMKKGIHLKGFVNRYRCKDGSYKTILWDAPPYIDGKYSYTISRVVNDV
jgi:PAS domain S-box-containing protein